MEIVYEDNHIIIVVKRCGEIVQGDKTGDQPLSERVKQYLKEKYHKPGAVFLGVVHRLDRPVSGLVVFARTSKALTRLNRMFAEGQVHKTYWAVVELQPNNGAAPPPSPLFGTPGENSQITGENSSASHLPSEGKSRDGITSGSVPTETEEGATLQYTRLEHWLVRNEKQNKSYAYDRERPHSKHAILEYRAIGRSDHYALLEVRLLTGRHHQIRCQLAAIGHPIKGDLKYGARRSNPDGGISLTARRVEFVHPVTGEAISVEAPWHGDATIFK